MRFLSLFLILAALPAQSQTLIEHYRRGVQAAQEGRYEDYLAAVEDGLALAPELPVLHRHRAQALARIGRGEEAMAELRVLLSWGVAFEPEEREDFASLRERADWSDFMEDYAASREPAGSMEFAFEIAVDDLIPEGIAHDAVADGFLVSSIAHRTIYRVALDGAAQPLFERGAHGYLGGLGLAVDTERGRLWAVSDAPDDSALFAPGEIGHSAVHVFDLRSGELLWSRFSEGDNAQSFNDVVVLPSGDAVVSAAQSGALLRFPAEGGEPTVLVQAGSVPGANGLCLSADGRELYVSAYIQGILRVDLERGTIRPASRSTAFTTAGTDGLYLDGDRLVAIQNANGLDRVALFSLDSDGQIDGLAIPVARQEIFVDPTTGAIREGKLYFIANSQVEPFLSRADKSVRSGFERTRVYSISLE